MSILAITLFGHPTITLNDEPVTGFPSSKVTALIYYLAATGRSHSRDTLAGLLWPDYADAQAKKNLRGALYHARNKLDAFLDVTRQHAQFQHASADIRVDSLRFDQHLADAQSLPTDSAERIIHLEAAVQLYRAELLAGFHTQDTDLFEEWVLGERERYSQLALQALHQLVVHNAEQGQMLAGIDYATRLLAFDPWREEIHRHLMMMLALDGQQSAALAQYETCRAVLHDELGVAPETETTELYNRIQAGEFTDAATLTIAAPTPTTRHNLPADLTTFIGREAELAQIYDRLQDPACRLLTIVGSGGIGKTRLALQAARHFHDETAYSTPADGVYFIPLTAIEPDAATGPAQIADRIATAIAQGVQLPLSGTEAPAAQMQHALSTKDMLLLLDNFEQLRAAASYLSTLLESAPALKLLVTSRERLNLLGEQVVALDGLTMPAAESALASSDGASILDDYSATALFMMTARAVAPHFTMQPADHHAIMQTCRLVEGVPLGIELAATWTRLLPCAEIAAEIQQNMDFLDGTMVNMPERHRSLRAVFTHSWQLLAAEEQQALRRLAVFRGGFTRTAANAVAGASLPILALLVDRSLIRRSIRGSAEAGQVRFELLEVSRQYAAEQLDDAAETAPIAARHAAHYAGLLAAQLPALQANGQSQARDLIEADRANVRTAWLWNCQHLHAGGRALANIGQSLEALFHFLDMGSWFQEGANLFADAADALYPIAQTDQLDAQLIHAKVQARQGWFVFHLGNYDESLALLQSSLTTLRALDATSDMIFNLNYLGAVARHLGDYGQGKEWLTEARAQAEQHHEQLGLSIALNILGQIASLEGDLPAAQELCQQALAVKRAIGDRWGMTYSLGYLGRVMAAQGDYDAAINLYAESRTICEEIGDRRGVAFALRNLGDVAHQQGDAMQATACYEESLQIYRSIGNRMEEVKTAERLTQSTGA